MRTFVIGDVHGQLFNLLALLEKAGLIRDGKRTDSTRIVQLGDLGDFRATTVLHDTACYQAALALDIEVLWGNHDYACFDARHAFKGWSPATPELASLVITANPQFAAHAHGFLLTHAGLHPVFAPVFYNSVEEIENSINAAPALFSPVINDMGPLRGGYAPVGGILWRDDREPLAPIPQVFGHSRGIVRSYGGKRFCIDVGSRYNGNLAGMWLPDMRVVAVGIDHETNEMALNGEKL